jgi:hypothetical protein
VVYEKQILIFKKIIMESLSSKEFFEQLNTNNLKPSFTLKGIVKKSAKDSEVLFTKKGDFEHWVSIPASMIESVTVLKTFSKENETYTVVKLHMKTPTTAEGEVLLKLLSSNEMEEMTEEKCGWKNRLMGRCGCSGMRGKLFGRGCMHHHFGGGCHHWHHEVHEQDHKNKFMK